MKPDETLLDVLKIKREHLSIGALTQFAKFNSSPRGEMLARQVTKSIVLNKGEVRWLLSGLEVEYGKTTVGIVLENNCQIYTVLGKYMDDILIEVLVVFQDIETGVFDFRIIPKYMKYHPKFGFNMLWADGLIDLEYGDILPAGTSLCTTAGLDVNSGALKYGVNVKVALTSDPQVAEDAIVLSKAKQKDFEFTYEVDYDDTLKNDEVPLNLFGTIDEPQILPKVGDKVRSDGVIFAKRRIPVKGKLALLSKRALTKLDTDFDTPIVTRAAHGVIASIEVNYNDAAFKKPEMPELYTQLHQHVDKLRNHEKKLIEIGNTIVREYGPNTVIDDELHSTLVTLGMKYHPKVAPTKKRAKLDPFSIKIKVRYTGYPDLGYKLAGLNGGKGIVCSIVEEEEMPIDADGNRAELKMYMGSIIGRMNVGTLYEQYITSCIPKLRDKVITMYNGQGIELAWEYLLGFLKILDTNQYTHFKGLGKNDITEIIRGLDRGYPLYVYLPVDNDKDAMSITIELANSEYKATKGPVSFMGANGEVVTKASIIIGPMYMSLLAKIGDSWLSAAGTYVNHYGLPTGLTKPEESRSPWSRNPVRFGNSEIRLMAAYTLSPEALIRMKERANSIPVQCMIYRKILEAKNPTDIQDAQPREEQEYGTDQTMILLQDVLATFGYVLEYVKEGTRE